MATHDSNGGFGGHPSPGAALGEGHCDGFAREGIVDRSGQQPRFYGGFVGGGIVDESCEFGGCEVCDAEEVPGCEGGGCVGGVGAERGG